MRGVATVNDLSPQLRSAQSQIEVANFQNCVKLTCAQRWENSEEYFSIDAAL